MNKHITFRTLGSPFQRKQEKGELRVPSKIPACRKKACLNFFNFPIRRLFFTGEGGGGEGKGVRSWGEGGCWERGGKIR